MTKTKAHFAIQKAQSEIRTRVREINALPDDKLTPELRGELNTLYKTYEAGEIEFRASLEALQVEQAAGLTVVDAEARELQLLTDKANVGDIILAAIEKRQTTGETSELQKHYGISSHQIPVEMLRVDRGTEERASATVPDSIGDAVQAEVITPVFSSGDGAFLGIERPTVPVGDAAYPVLSTAPSVKGPFTDSTDAAQTDAVFSANNLSPERLQASYAYRRSDLARFRSLDASLRLALNGGLQEKLDQQAIAGTDGLLTGTNLANNNVTTETTFALYLSGLLYGRVDGRYARSPADVRVLVGQPAYNHASGVYKSAESDETASERLAARSGGLMVSSHVPAISSKRANCVSRLGMAPGGATQPTWQGISVVVDEFSRSVQGEVVIHAILLSNFAITRAAQFAKQQIQIP